MHLRGKTSTLLVFIILACPLLAQDKSEVHSKAPAFIPFEISSECSLRPLIEYTFNNQDNAPVNLADAAARLRNSSVKKVPATVALGIIPELLIELCHIFEARMHNKIEKSAFDVIVSPAVSMLRSLISILHDEGKKRNETAAQEYNEIRDFIQQTLLALGQQDVIAVLDQATFNQSNSLVAYNGGACHDKKTYELVQRLHEKLDELELYLEEQNDELENLIVDEMANSVDEIQSFVAAENEVTRDTLSSAISDGNQNLSDEILGVEDDILDGLYELSEQIQDDLAQTWTMIGSVNDSSAVFTTAAQIDNAQLSVIGWLKSIYRQLIGV